MNTVDLKHSAAVTLHVVGTGSANIAAVCSGLERLHGPTSQPVETRVTTAIQDVSDAPLLVLPGVGTFGAVMQRLVQLDLTGAIRERIELGRPTLCICLGLQIMASCSEESPGIHGLGVLSEDVVAIPPATGCRIPHMGWNCIEASPECSLLASDEMYFANSYCLSKPPEGWNCAWVHHGSRFIAAIERGPVVACQCHPELSGPAGARLMQRWLDLSLATEQHSAESRASAC